MSDPVLVEVTRGGAVESRHRGAAAVADAEGAIVAAWGDVERPVFPRSAVKPIQALPLLETGAAERFQLSDAEVALACASHNGEAEHTRAVAVWLRRLGLAAGDLECGAHAPTYPETAKAQERRGEAPSALDNNCSGKHAGFLATALFMGEPTRGYIEPGHPVQKRVGQALAEMTGCDLAAAPWGVDGCGIPTFALPLAAIARAMARLAAPEGLAPARRRAAERIVAAMAAHPHLIAGQERFDTRAIAAAHGAFVVKGGAEGVHAAIVPGRGLGLALKIEDGAARASDVAMTALLAHLGLLTNGIDEALEDYAPRPIYNVAGRAVGEVRATAGWPG